MAARENRNRPSYNTVQMSRLFESFEYLDRGWDVRVLENSSLRRLFVWLLLFVFLLGMDVFAIAYQVLRLRHLNWSIVLNLLTLGVLAFRYSRAIYRRLS
jgi:hypothetical protein